MSHRIVGEFRPPRELAAIATARVAGRGTLEVSATGVTIEAEIHDADPSFPLWWIGLPLALVAVAVAVWVDEPNRILGPLTVVVLLLYFWSRFRSEYGRRGTFHLVWVDIEHVVRMPSDPEVLGFVLGRPVGGAGTPEQVFFAPTAGVQVLVDALRTSGPASLPIDLESADRVADPDQQPAD